MFFGVAVSLYGLELDQQNPESFKQWERHTSRPWMLGRYGDDDKEEAIMAVSDAVHEAHEEINYFLTTYPDWWDSKVRARLDKLLKEMDEVRTILDTTPSA